MNGEVLDPMTMIPEALRVERRTIKLTEEQEKAETRAALMLMGECLKAGL